MLKSIFVGILPLLVCMPCAAPAASQANATAEPSAQEKAHATYAKGQEALAGDTEASMEEAVKYFQEAARLDPKSAAAYDWLGMAYVQVGQFDKSIEVEGPRSGGRGRRGPGGARRCLRRGQPDRARPCLRRGGAARRGAANSPGVTCPRPAQARSASRPCFRLSGAGGKAARA
jgi:TPR repeat protein